MSAATATIMEGIDRAFYYWSSFRHALFDYEDRAQHAFRGRRHPPWLISCQVGPRGSEEGYYYIGCVTNGL